VTRKVYNFSAGPAMLPEEVLLQAQAELLDWEQTGMSIMEYGHRTEKFQEMIDRCEADLRELMSIPTDYHVLFIPGGATAQFAMVPINLFGTKASADYIDSGIWSKRAIVEAKRYGDIKVAATLTKKDGLTSIPPEAEWQLNKEACYVHYTPNETIEGIEFDWTPCTDGVPLVADMSSTILSRPVDVSKYGIIYAGAQKNVGQAGITLVIIHRDLLKSAPLPRTPTLYQYQTHAENHSLYNTPPTFSWYITGLMLAWMKRHGGVAKFYEINKRKAGKLYHCIDSMPDFYHSNVHPSCRSLMNVPFSIKDDAKNDIFLEEAQKIGLENLKGHRLAGALRASIYNAMPEAGIDKLVSFMTDFAKKHG